MDLTPPKKSKKCLLKILYELFIFVFNKRYTKKQPLTCIQSLNTNKYTDNKYSYRKFMIYISGGQNKTVTLSEFFRKFSSHK